MRRFEHIKKICRDVEYHPPKCSRFKTRSFNEPEGYFNWRMPQVVETENLYGLLDYPHKRLHWKPKKEKTKYIDVSDEEIKLLYIKAINFWYYALGRELIEEPEVNK